MFPTATDPSLADPFVAPRAGHGGGGFGSPESPRIEKSPYVQRLEDDARASTAADTGGAGSGSETGGGVDPPSVIAAREQAYFGSMPASPGPGSGFEDGGSVGFGSGSAGYIPPFEPPSFSPPRETNGGQGQGYQGTDRAEQNSPKPPAARRGLPSDLIDDDLLAASDPSLSLKKAFVKSSGTSVRGGDGLSRTGSAGKKGGDKFKKYVFTPQAKRSEEKKDQAKNQDANGEDKKGDGKSKADEGEANGETKNDTKEEPTPDPKADIEAEEKETPNEEESRQKTKVETAGKSADEDEGVEKDAKRDEDAVGSSAPSLPANATTETTPSTDTPQPHSSQSTHDASAPTTSSADSPPTPKASESVAGEDTPKKVAANIPLPESTLPTPTVTRPASRSSSPTPSSAPSSAIQNDSKETPEPSPATLAVTPTTDRVAVSPLEQPSEPDFGFKALSIGAASAPTPPAKDSDGWGTTTSNTATSTGSRFGGKGWGALDDEEEDDGLFGKAGPSVRAVSGVNATDGWGDSAEGGWGEPGLASLPPLSTDSMVSRRLQGRNVRIWLTSVHGVDTRRGESGYAHHSICAISSSKRYRTYAKASFQTALSDLRWRSDPSG